MICSIWLQRQIPISHTTTQSKGTNTHSWYRERERESWMDGRTDERERVLASVCDCVSPTLTSETPIWCLLPPDYPTPYRIHISLRHLSLSLLIASFLILNQPINDPKTLSTFHQLRLFPALLRDIYIYIYDCP